MKKVGKAFTYRRVRLLTVQQEGCDGCYFNDDELIKCKDTRFTCSKYDRKDEIPVIFKLTPFIFGR